VREAYEDVTLSHEADQALLSVLRWNVGVAADCLREMRAGEPVAAVCINLTQDDSLGVPDLYVVRDRDFRRAVEELRDPEQWLDLWNPGWYPEEDFVETPLIEDAEFADAERGVLDALEAQVVDPHRWVMLRVARRLNPETFARLRGRGLIGEPERA
jgi:hypothetical protein